MKNLTYSCSGVYNPDTKELNFEIIIPKESSDNSYIFYPFYNLSKNLRKVSSDKNDSERHKNVILVFFKKTNDSGDLMQEETNVFMSKINMEYKSVFEHPDLKEFDMDLDENPLLIIIHNNLFEIEIVNSIFDNLQVYYDNYYIDKNTQMPLYNFPNAKGGPKLTGSGNIRKD